MEAVYIVDINGHVILDYPVASTPPTVQSLLPHVMDVEPDSNIVEISPTRLLYHQKHGTVLFLVPCTSTIPALVPFEFINRLVEVLEVYFSPPLIPMKIESHLDTTTLILNEMIEGGSPGTTDPDPMKELVPYGGLFTKLLSGATGGGGGSVNAPSTVPWRRANVRHTNNELFVDLVETLYVIVSPSSKSGRSQRKPMIQPSAFYSASSSSSVASSAKPVLCRAEGAVFVTSHLSGVPDVQLVLNTGRQFDSPSFHQCVDLSKWQQSPGTMSFIPPDGKSLIASYTIDHVGQGLVYADLQTGLGVNKDEFEARVWTMVSKDVKAVEGLNVHVVCGSRVRHVKGMRVTAGDFHLNESGTGEWRFPGKTALGWNATLRGALQGSAAEEAEEDKIHFPKYLALSYSLTGQVPSGVKVQSLKILSSRGLGEGVKPYKGVRYSTVVGEWIVR